jgi:spermidine synthase
MASFASGRGPCHCIKRAHRVQVMKLFKEKPPPSKFDILSKSRSRFNEIYVIQNGYQREMWFKEGGQFFLQSRLNLETRESPVLIYSKMMLASLLFQSSPGRILMMGLGGGSISNILHHVFPETHIDVVEVDPNVIDISKRFFYLRETKNYKIHPLDARIFIKSQMGKNTYDLILLDAFKSGSVPFHLKTEEFYQEILEVLSPNGVVASNLYGKSNLKKPSDRTTFETLFGNLYFFEDPDQVATVLIATNQERFWSDKDVHHAAEVFKTKVPFSMPEVASMYRPDLLGYADGEKFLDDFEAKDFRRAVEENNTHRGKKIQYPIKSYS